MTLTLHQRVPVLALQQTPCFSSTSEIWIFAPGGSLDDFQLKLNTGKIIFFRFRVKKIGLISTGRGMETVNQSQNIVVRFTLILSSFDTNPKFELGHTCTEYAFKSHRIVWKTLTTNEQGLESRSKQKKTEILRITTIKGFLKFYGL
jgi:hypothetical protein